MMVAPTVQTRGWTLQDRAESIWWNVPFDLPGDAGGFQVTLEVDRPDAVIDLGLEGADGWRGWSGGARREFYVGAEWATPGYLPGALEPGTWNVVLGLHRLPAAVVETTVTVTFGRLPRPAVALPPVSDRPPRRTLPAPAGMQWLACDFHSHTVHSDGVLTPAELAVLAAGKGLDVLAVTDHNTTSHHADLPALGDRYGIGLVAGQEITTDAGHANAFGDIGFIDFRQPALQWLIETERRGGLLSINHPLAADCAWRWPMAERPPLAEIWHSSWLAPTWGGPIAWWEAWGTDVVPIGGSDFHRFGGDATPGSPTTWVCVDAAGHNPAERAAAVREGLSAGRTSISAGPEAPVALADSEFITVIGAEGALLVSPGYRRRLVRSEHQTFAGCPPGGHYLIGQDGAVLAITSVSS